MKATRTGYIYALLCLHKIHKERLYKQINPDFRQYLKLRWGFKKSTIYNHLKVIETFLPYLEQGNGDYPDFKRLEQTHKIIEHAPEKTEELYHMALVNSDEDFENNLKELQGKIPTDVCEHPANKEKIIKTIVCGVCGKALGRVME
jgi:hypothetical protein